MTSFGEGGQGPVHNQLTEEVHRNLLDQMGRAGWIFAGGEGDDLPHQIAIIRDPQRGNMSPEEAIARLDLAGEDGELLPGYEVAVDDESGQLELGYEGPGDDRYAQFLVDVGKLGRAMDKAVIEASPYPEALEHWRTRRSLYGPRSYDSLDPHLKEGLKDLRDHVVIEEGGVDTYAELLAAGDLAPPGDESQAVLNRMAAEVRQAAALESPAERNVSLDIALQDADGAMSRAIEAAQLAAIRTHAPVAEAFAREVLVDNPLYGRDSVTEEELDGLLDFEDGPNRLREWKVSRLSEILYHAHTSIEARGLLHMLTEPSELLDGRTPHQVIESGATNANEALLSWAVGLRGMVAS